MNFHSKMLDGIALFVEVVNQGSFSGAAESCEHSASHLSKAINKLEARLGVRLLNRSTRSLQLTAEGQQYFEHCQTIINEAQKAESQLLGQQDEPGGTLRVSCPVSFGINHLSSALTKFIERYPHVNLELDLNDQQVDIISEGYDIAIRASVALVDSSLVSRRFMRSKGLTLAAASYLKKHGTPKTPTELSDHQVISYRYLKQPSQWHYQSRDGKSQNIRVANKILTNSPEMELALCCAGVGITRLPAFNLGNELSSGVLVELFTDYQAPTIDVYMIYPCRKNMPSKLRCFIDFIIEEFGN